MEQYIIANCTDVGVARQVNEDSMVTFESPNGRVVAVCDGMGGQAAGDLASQLACSIIRDILENNTFNTPAEAITTAIMAANQGILHRAGQDPALEGMGSTCVLVIIRDGLVYYGWVGDSRIYYIANHNIRQISRDQSYVQQLVDSGEITPEEAEHHPQKNEILNALGLPGMTPPEIGTPLRPEPGSVILLCSDGLTGMVDNRHIEHTVSNKAMPLAQRAAKLVGLANTNGGLDNITVQLVEFPTAAGAYGTPKKPAIPVSLIAAIVTAMIILGVSLWLLMGGSKNKSADTSPVTTEDNRTPQDKTTKPAKTTTPSTTVTKKTVIEEKTGKPKKEVNPKDKVINKGKGSGKKVDEKFKKKNGTVGVGPTESGGQDGNDLQYESFEGEKFDR